MKHSKPVRLESRYIPDTSGQAGQARTYQVGIEALFLL